MKHVTKLMIALLVAALVFGSTAFAASSDNQRVVSRISSIDPNLANIAEQFLNEDAAHGKTLTADQADQMIAIIGEAESTYLAAVNNGDRSDATFTALSSAFTRALAVANISGTPVKNGDGTVTVSVYDNDTKISASFTVSAVAGGKISTSGFSISTAGAVNYVGKTAIDNSAFIVAGILGALAIASGFVVYRRRVAIG